MMYVCMYDYVQMKLNVVDARPRVEGRYNIANFGAGHIMWVTGQNGT